LRVEERRDRFEGLRDKYKCCWMNFNDELLKMNIEGKLMKNEGKGIKNKMEYKRGQCNFSICGRGKTMIWRRRMK
jgi:hypothetical protein